MDLALNNLQRLICHKTQPTNQPTSSITIPCIREGKYFASLLICRQNHKDYLKIDVTD